MALPFSRSSGFSHCIPRREHHHPQSSAAHRRGARRSPGDAHTGSRLPQTKKPVKPEGFTPKKREFPAKPDTEGRTFTELQRRRPGLIPKAHDRRRHPWVHAVAGPAYVLHRPAHGEGALVPERLLQLSKHQPGGSTAASWGRHKPAPGQGCFGKRGAGGAGLGWHAERCPDTCPARRLARVAPRCCSAGTAPRCAHAWCSLAHTRR